MVFGSSLAGQKVEAGPTCYHTVDDDINGPSRRRDGVISGGCYWRPQQLPRDPCTAATSKATPTHSIHMLGRPP
eukprot:162694-Prymnesium_polylepis.1